MHTGLEAGAGNGCKLASADAAQCFEGVGKMSSMKLICGFDRIAFTFNTRGINAGSWAHPIFRFAAEQRSGKCRGGSGIANPHFTEQQNIRVPGNRITSNRNRRVKFRFGHCWRLREVGRRSIECDGDDG